MRRCHLEISAVHRKAALAEAILRCEPTFTQCHWNIDGQKIRVADIDAPEIHPPGCAPEADLGTRATHRLQELVNTGPFAVTTLDREADKYGRKLRVLTRGGQSLGDVLVSEGLARTCTGKREPWC